MWKKKSTVSWVKVDAAQLFEDSSTDRGILRAKMLFNRIMTQQGKNTVAIYKTKGASELFCNTSTSTTFCIDMLSFNEHKNAMRSAAEDNIFRLGTEFVRWTKGWAMGGCMSEPATLVNLGHNVHMLHRSAGKARDCGFVQNYWSINNIIQGVIYVDDVPTHSKVLCPDCLCKGPRKMWPKDMGITLGARDMPLDYLQARMIEKRSHCYCIPFSTNEDFANQITNNPKVAQLADYKFGEPMLSYKKTSGHHY